MNQNLNDTWIKLYRKLCDHEIMRDSVSLQIFIWILLRVEFEKGSMVCGRFWASEMLGTNPNTFYKALKRLEKKYDLVTLSSNNKNTTILVKNWKSYQQTGNTISNNKVTTKEQQSNTKQEYNNKRIKNNINIYISSFNELFKSSYKETAGRSNKLSVRLKTYSMEMILKSLNNMASNKFYHGENERGWKADPDFLIRSDEQIDKFLNMKPIESQQIKKTGYIPKVFRKEK